MLDVANCIGDVFIVCTKFNYMLLCTIHVATVVNTIYVLVFNI